jgi:diphosphomevalonate decarboxylase
VNNTRGTATAVAHSNIALVKYWGKRNPELNLPATGSISLTLKELFTRTSVTFNSSFQNDILYLNDQLADKTKTQRVSRFLNHIRKLTQSSQFAEIRSVNSFPTGAGLASSASGFAALAIAATQAAGLKKTKCEHSMLARIGSGSAARSVYGGFVEMQAGTQDTGSDSYAVQIQPADYWDLRLIIAITSTDEKKIGSTIGMRQTARTSPYYAGWVSSTRQDLVEMRTAIKKKDFQLLGELTEHSCLKMHALAMSARPPVLYVNNTTLCIIEEVCQLRKNGIQAYFTIDAGPQVKIVCLPGDVARIRECISQISNVKEIIHTELGPDAFTE